MRLPKLCDLEPYIADACSVVRLSKNVLSLHQLQRLGERSAIAIKSISIWHDGHWISAVMAFQSLSQYFGALRMMSVGVEGY